VCVGSSTSCEAWRWGALIGRPCLAPHIRRSFVGLCRLETPSARLWRAKGAGKEAKLRVMGQLLMENRSGLVVASRLTQATGLAEREAARQADRGRAGLHGITADLADRPAAPCANPALQSGSPLRSDGIMGRSDQPWTEA
jgi:hypothetical protein